MKKVVTSQKDYWSDHIIPSSSDELKLQEVIPFLKKKLQKKQAELKEYLHSRDVKRRQSSPAKHADETDRSEADVNFNRNVSEEKFRRKNLQEIFYALERIDEGKYGYCINCEEVIEVERLKARPMALRCIDCESVFEKNGGGKWTQVPTWK